MTTTSVDQVAAYLLAHDRFVFTTHLTPDGDGIGSQLGLLRFLRALGKDVVVINCSSVPVDLRFLARAGEVITYQKDKHAATLADAGAIVAFDLGGVGRLGKMEEPVRASGATKILIDHHVYENDIFDLPLVESHKSSSAEITYDIIKACGGVIDLAIAEPLYVGVVQDTGSFNYGSTSPRTHWLAAEFLEAGVNPYRIWRKLNCQKPFKRVRLMGECIARIEMLHAGRVSAVRIDLEFLRAIGGEVRDAFEVVNHLLTIEGVDVGVLALQIGSQRTKFSLRSAGKYDVFRVAREFGGGGHRHAAGCVIDGADFDVACRTMMDRVLRVFEPLGVGTGDDGGRS